MIRVAVVGATGYAGAELVRILAAHPQVEVAALTSRKYAGKAISEVFPAFGGVVENVCETYDAAALAERCDFFFLALPHKVSMAIVPELMGHGKPVVDLSADFRFSDAALYESCYQPHTSAELLVKAVYGLCEVHFEKIRTARLVGNPGCYPTSILLPLVPLVKSGLIDTTSIIADAKSGVSGAGRSLSLATHFCEVNESFTAYKVAAHRHQPEMEEQLGLAAGKPVRVTFTPHLVPMNRGMLATIYADLATAADRQDIHDCLASCYDGRPFIRLCDGEQLPDTACVRQTNFCDIGFRIDARNNRLVMIAAIDNLVKGAAGQAVQNMNIMCGLEETAGLLHIPAAV